MERGREGCWAWRSEWMLWVWIMARAEERVPILRVSEEGFWVGMVAGSVGGENAMVEK